MPRRIRKQSCGPGTLPTAFWKNFSSVQSASSSVMTAPPRASLWPLMYFVVE